MERGIGKNSDLDGKEDVSKGARILIVDDEPLIRLRINHTLADDGYNVCEASTAEDALDNMNDTVFDLIITDIKMPGMNGLELLREVKRAHPHIDVIVLTGCHEPAHQEYCARYGAADFITKSSILDDLWVSVKRTLLQRFLPAQTTVGITPSLA